MYRNFAKMQAKQDSSSEYELITSCKANGGIPVYRYKSKTGMTVVIAQVEGPLVNGYFCLGMYGDCTHYRSLFHHRPDNLATALSLTTWPVPGDFVFFYNLNDIKG